MKKYLWLISQNIATTGSNYDSAVVCAQTEEEARQIHPGRRTGAWWDDPHKAYRWEWAHKDQVQVELIGIANDSIKPGLVLASFNES